jgi:hypothetical protein
MEQHEDYFHNDRAQASRWVIDDGDSQEQIQRMVVSMFLLTYSRASYFGGGSHETVCYSSHIFANNSCTPTWMDTKSE